MRLGRSFGKASRSGGTGQTASRPAYILVWRFPRATRASPLVCSSSLLQWDGQWAAHTSIPPSPHRPFAHGIMHALANTRLPPPLLHPTPTLRSWPLWQQWKLQARSQQASLLELPLPHPATARIGEAVPPPPTSPGLTKLLQPAARCGRPQDWKLRPAALRHAWPPFPASLSKLPAAPSSASMASRHLRRLPPGGPLPLRGTQAKKLIGRPRIPSNGMAPRACRYSRPRRGGSPAQDPVV